MWFHPKRSRLRKLSEEIVLTILGQRKISIELTEEILVEPKKAGQRQL